jgi:hypothetical protein
MIKHKVVTNGTLFRIMFNLDMDEFSTWKLYSSPSLVFNTKEEADLKVDEFYRKELNKEGPWRDCEN